MVGLAACGSAPTQRQLCLSELRRFHGHAVSVPAAQHLEARLETLETAPGPSLLHRELAWLLVDWLGLGYRLRQADGPLESQALLEDMGLMRPSSGAAPVSLDELRRLLNRAALPETELLLPGPCPLPEWLWTP